MPKKRKSSNLKMREALEESAQAFFMIANVSQKAAVALMRALEDFEARGEPMERRDE